MFCPSCGKALPDQSQYCMHCGADITKLVGVATTAAPILPVRRRSVPLLVLIPLGVIALGVLGWILLSPRGGAKGATLSLVGGGGDKIAYTVWDFDTEAASIWVMNPDGAEKSALTDEFGRATLPSWSPDGKQIAFVVWRNQDVYLYVMDADGGNQKRLMKLQGADDYDSGIATRLPRWSPDGTRILVCAGQYGSRGLSVVQVESGQITELISTDEDTMTPVWSPDGTQIAYVEGDFGAEMTTLCVARPMVRDGSS